MMLGQMNKVDEATAEVERVLAESKVVKEANALVLMLSEELLGNTREGGVLPLPGAEEFHPFL